MDKTDKGIELLKLVKNSPMYEDAAQCEKHPRTFVFAGASGDEFVRFHDVSLDKPNRFLGFVAVDVPDPTLADEQQLEALDGLYEDGEIVKHCLKSIAILRQQAARKVATGGTKTIPKAEFNRRYDSLDADTLRRLKSMEHITKHIEDEWQEEQTDVTDGELRLF